MMIRESLDHALPEPDFAQRGGEFTIAVWRDGLTNEVLAAVGLNDRQQRAVVHVKTTGRIGNTDYQQLNAATKKTASRDLEDLVSKGRGIMGRGTHYVLARKGDITPPRWLGSRPHPILQSEKVRRGPGTVVLGLLLIFPQLSLWLPQLVRG